MSGVPKIVELRHQGFKRALDRGWAAYIESRGKDLTDAQELVLPVLAEELWSVVEDLAHEPCTLHSRATADCRERSLRPLCLSCRARHLVGWP